MNEIKKGTCFKSLTFAGHGKVDNIINDILEITIFDTQGFGRNCDPMNKKDFKEMIDKKIFTIVNEVDTVVNIW